MEFLYVLIIWTGTVGSTLVIAPVTYPAPFSSEAACEAEGRKLIEIAKRTTGATRNWKCGGLIIKPSDAAKQ